MNKKFSLGKTSDEFITLNSCGIQKFYDADGHCIRKNGRVDYHILYIAEGYCYLTVNNETQKIPKGSFILFYPNDPQQYSFYAKDKSISYYLHFTGRGCNELLKSLNLMGKKVIYTGKNIHYEDIFEKMLREHSIKLRSHETYCSGLLIELLSVISRYHMKNTEKSEIKYENIVEEAKLFVYQNLKDVTVIQLATNAFLSVGRFSHIFKDVTGESPLEYINSMKVQKAKDLITYTSLPFNEVAKEIGIYDQNYFSRLFKKHVGLSPSEYKKTFN